MVDIKEHLDIKVWTKLQDQISNIYKTKISLVDLFGNELHNSNLPYYCKLVKTKDKGKQNCKESYKHYLNRLKREKKNFIEFKCSNLVSNIIYPINIRNEIIGGIVFQIESNEAEFQEISKQLNIEEDELKDAFSKLIKPDSPYYKQISEVFSHNIPMFINSALVSRKKLSALSMLESISNLLNSTLEIKKIMTEIIRFIVTNNFAKMCSVVIFNPMRRFTLNESSLPTHYTDFETKMIKEILKDKKSRGIANLSKDKRFNSKANFTIYDALFSLPIISQGVLLGVLNIYESSIEKLKQNIELFSIIANQASIAINNAKQYELIKETAITDKLTGLYNRLKFMDVLEQEISRSKRFQHSISIAMLDIDHFKHYNDTNGHPKGDVLLEECSKVLKDSVRDIDTVGRYGGEEFIIVFPEIKPSEILTAAKRVVENVANTKFFNRESQPNKKVTISMGLLTCMDASLSPQELINEADKALYDAKNNGRNQVIAKVVLKKGTNAVDVT